MKNLIERYVYDVVRRLPEQEQDEVGKELRSNIYDMLPDGAEDDDISTVLTELGAPALLAEQYRQNPRCLISAAFYDDYLRALKWVLPLVGCVLMVIGLLSGGADAIKDKITDFPRFVGAIIGSGVSSGISGAIQALVWVTAGFAIADRASKKTITLERWSIKDLPENIPYAKKTIPFSDSIIELTIIAFFSTVGVLLCHGQIPIPFILRGNDVQMRQLFSNEFLIACIPAIIVGGVLRICECVAKIMKRSWTSLVCGTIIVSNMTNIGLLLYLCSKQNIFSLDFLTFAKSQGWKWYGDAPLLENTLIMLVVAIIIVTSFVECGMAAYHAAKDAKSD